MEHHVPTTTLTTLDNLVSPIKDQPDPMNLTREQAIPTSLNTTARILSKLIRARHHLEEISYYLSGSNLPSGYMHKARILIVAFTPSGASDTTLEDLSSASTPWTKQSHEILQRHYRAEEVKNVLLTLQHILMYRLAGSLVP